jgi:hypothetical protein
MRSIAFMLLAALAAPAAAQQQEIQRALVQRDQQSAEFAAQVRGGYDARTRLEALHARQLSDTLVPLSPNPAVATTLLPYQRSRMADESVLQLGPPIVRNPATPEVERALPLPGGPRLSVDPVTPQNVGP